MGNAAKDSPTSLATKQHLSETLKKMMRTTKFNRITISALVGEAKVNRKTFYYHFRSVPELLAWTFEKEALEMVANFDFIKDYTTALNFIMDYVERNQDLIQAAMSSIGRNEVRKFLYNDIYGVVLKHVQQAIPSEDSDFQEITAEFYSEAFAGVLIRWIEKPAEHSYSREKLVDYFTRLFEPYLSQAQE